MAHIKFKYYEYRCGVGDYSYIQKRCEYPQQNDECKYFKGQWFDEEKQMLCGNAYKSYTVFENDYKRYEVNEFELWIPRRHIEMDCIEYLEIDGKVIVADTPQTETQTETQNSNLTFEKQTDCPWK